MYPINAKGRWLQTLMREGPSAARGILDLLPCALAIWTPQGVLCFLNAPGRRLLGLSPGAQVDASAWIGRIDPADRERFALCAEKVRRGEAQASCDYQFWPLGASHSVWLREMSVGHQNDVGETYGVVSHYSNITDLVKNGSTHRPREITPKFREIFNGLTHEIHNNLQVISMALELLKADTPDSGDAVHIREGIHNITRSISDVSEYFSAKKNRLSEQSLQDLTEDIVRQKERELGVQNIQLRWLRGKPLPEIRLDVKQFRRAVEGVVDFSCSLLPKGGQIEIAPHLRFSGAARYVELEVNVCSPCPLVVEESAIFRPFLRVNKRQVGLSLALAREILHRHRGEILFEKTAPQQVQFNIVLEVR